jgi:hypothetical protein
MNDIEMRLPIRLLPRRGAQIFPILFFGFFFCFSIFWIAMASGAVVVPPDFRDRVREAASAITAPAASIAAAAKRSSVIER